jgi:hypothetical protein
VDAVFHDATCAQVSPPPCGTCSCTAPYDYWSSTTYVNAPEKAWLVVFSAGDVVFNVKAWDIGCVRAVRGGL